MNDYEEKYRRATAELEYAGLQERGYPAPYLGHLRKAGFKPRPKYYRSKAARLTVGPLLFGGIWGLAMYIAVLPPNCLILRFVLYSLAFGVFFTLAEEITIRRARKRHKLSTWEDF